MSIFVVFLTYKKDCSEGEPIDFYVTVTAKFLQNQRYWPDHAQIRMSSSL